MTIGLITILTLQFESNFQINELHIATIVYLFLNLTNVVSNLQCDMNVCLLSHNLGLTLKFIAKNSLWMYLNIVCTWNVKVDPPALSAS